MDNALSRILKNAIFEIHPKEAQTSTKLKTWIQRLGGVCVISETDDDQNHSHKQSFAIPLIDLAWCKVHNISIFHKPKEHKFRDFYSSTFIYECHREKQRLDLNSYRLGRSSLISYDGNLFLDQKLSWDELLAKSCQIVLKEYALNDSTSAGKETQDDDEKTIEDQDAQSENEYQSQSQEEDQEWEEGVTDDKEEEIQELGITVNNEVQFPSTSSSRRTPTVMLCRIEHENQNTISQLRKQRKNTAKNSTCNRFRRNRLKPTIQSKQLVRKVGVPYSKDDSQKLLEYVCNNNLHNSTGGNLMWKYIEARKILSVSRTNQSLKEHFRRQILPNLKNFCISPEDVLKFEDAKKEREKGRRKPIMFVPS